MPRYDTSVQPPAPFADILILHPSDRKQTRRIRGKLDSGADISVIPESFLLPPSVSPSSPSLARSFHPPDASAP